MAATGWERRRRRVFERRFPKQRTAWLRRVRFVATNIHEKDSAPPRLTSGHFLARSFEGFAFALRETLDAMLGDFVEDGVHFAADEFIRREVRRRLRGGLQPGLCAQGSRTDQFALALPGLERTPAAPPLEPDGPRQGHVVPPAKLQPGDAGEHAAEVRGVGDLGELI